MKYEPTTLRQAFVGLVFFLAFGSAGVTCSLLFLVSLVKYGDRFPGELGYVLAGGIVALIVSSAGAGAAWSPHANRHLLLRVPLVIMAWLESIAVLGLFAALGVSALAGGILKGRGLIVVGFCILAALGASWQFLLLLVGKDRF